MICGTSVLPAPAEVEVGGWGLRLGVVGVRRVMSLSPCASPAGLRSSFSSIFIANLFEAKAGGEGEGLGEAGGRTGIKERGGLGGSGGGGASVSDLFLIQSH